MENDILRVTVKNISYQLKAQASIGIFNFIISVAVTRILVPKDFGIFSMATAMIFFLVILKDFGFQVATINKQDIDEDLLFETYFTITFFLECFFLMLCVPIYFLIRKVYGVDVTRAFLFLASVQVINGFKTVFQTKIIKALDFKKNASVYAIAQISKGITMYTCAKAGLKFYSLLLGEAVLALLSLFFFFSKTTWRPRRLRLERNIFRHYFDYFKRQFLPSAANFFTGNLHKFLTGNLAGIYNLGFYERAFSLAMYPKFNITDAILQVAGPTYAKLQRNTEELKSYLFFFVKNMSRITFIFAIISFAIIPEFVRIFWTEKWFGVVGNLRCMILFISLFPLLTNMDVFFSHSGKVNLVAYTILGFGVTSATLGVGLNFVLQEKGMSLGISIGAFIALVISQIIVQKKYFRFSILKVIKNQFWALLFSTFITVFLFERVFILNIYVSLLLKTFFAISTYFFVTYLLEGKEAIEEIKKFLKMLFERDKHV
jgi:O-antigen/teichoic acid export membrane protein